MILQHLPKTFTSANGPNMLVANIFGQMLAKCWARFRCFAFIHEFYIFSNHQHGVRNE